MIVDNKNKRPIIGVILIDGSIDGNVIASTNKPNLIRRFFLRLFFGWKWMEINKFKHV